MWSLDIYYSNTMILLAKNTYIVLKYHGTASRVDLTILNTERSEVISANESARNLR